MLRCVLESLALNTAKCFITLRASQMNHRSHSIVVAAPPLCQSAYADATGHRVAGQSGLQLCNILVQALALVAGLHERTPPRAAFLCNHLSARPNALSEAWGLFPYQNETNRAHEGGNHMSVLIVLFSSPRLAVQAFRRQPLVTPETRVSDLAADSAAWEGPAVSLAAEFYS